MKIFVTKTKIIAEQPLVFLQQADPYWKSLLACCIYMKLIERPILPLMISARGAASWRPSSANAQCDWFIEWSTKGQVKVSNSQPYT